MSARIRAFLGEAPRIPQKPAGGWIIGEDKILSEGSAPFDEQYEQAEQIMGDLKGIIKDALWEVLAEVFRKE